MDFFYIAISSPKAQECCCKEQYLIYCKINFQEVTAGSAKIPVLAFVSVLQCGKVKG